MFTQHNFSGKVQVRFMPKVYVSEEAYHDMAALVRLCDDEIGWLATAYQWDTGDYYIDRVFLFEQEVHSTTTEITPEGLAEWADKMLQDDAEEFLAIYDHIRCWGHSHVRMDTSPSKQDEDQMEVWADDCEFFVRVICNKNGKMSFDIFDYENGFVYKDCTWVVYYPDAEEDQRELFWKDEIEQKVSKKTYTSYTYYGKGKGTSSHKGSSSSRKGFTPSDKPSRDDDDDDYYEIVRSYYGNDYDVWDLEDYEEYWEKRKAEEEDEIPKVSQK